MVSSSQRQNSREGGVGVGMESIPTLWPMGASDSGIIVANLQTDSLKYYKIGNAAENAVATWPSEPGLPDASSECRPPSFL